MQAEYQKHGTIQAVWGAGAGCDTVSDMMHHLWRVACGGTVDEAAASSRCCSGTPLPSPCQYENPVLFEKLNRVGGGFAWIEPLSQNAAKNQTLAFTSSNAEYGTLANLSAVDRAVSPAGTGMPRSAAAPPTARSSGIAARGSCCRADQRTSLDLQGVREVVDLLLLLIASFREHSREPATGHVQAPRPQALRVALAPWGLRLDHRRWTPDERLEPAALLPTADGADRHAPSG